MLSSYYTLRHSELEASQIEVTEEYLHPGLRFPELGLVNLDQYAWEEACLHAEKEAYLSCGLPTKQVTDSHHP